MNRYGVYGIALHSEVPLALPTHNQANLAQIELRTAPAAYFRERVKGVELEEIPDSWCEFGRLPDGASYLHWPEVGEFLISADGKNVVCRQFLVAASESFHVYLLGRALSFALVQQGFEPLHATVVIVDGEAVAFLGHSGYGKSTLAASFLKDGHQIVTDDMLILQPTPNYVLAHPGPPRIKLFPEEAHRFLGSSKHGVPLSTDARKLILPVDAERSCSRPLPLRVVYSLAGPEDAQEDAPIRLARLSAREAFLELLKNTFNRTITDAGRLKRQIEHYSRLAGSVPIKKLSFARVIHQISSVREAILLDVSWLRSEGSACGV